MWSRHIDGTAGRETPGEADTDEQNHESDDAVYRVLQIEKRRSDTKQRQHADGFGEARVRAMRCGGVAGLRLSPMLLSYLMNDDWHGRQRHGEIGEQHGDELVASPTHTPQSIVHRLADDEAYRQRDDADDEPRGQREDDIKRESGHCAPDTKRECANERGMRVLRKLRLDLLRTLRA